MVPTGTLNVIMSVTFYENKSIKKCVFDYFSVVMY